MGSPISNPSYGTNHLELHTDDLEVIAVCVKIHNDGVIVALWLWMISISHFRICLDPMTHLSWHFVPCCHVQGISNDHIAEQHGTVSRCGVLLRKRKRRRRDCIRADSRASFVRSRRCMCAGGGTERVLSVG